MSSLGSRVVLALGLAGQLIACSPSSSESTEAERRAERKKNWSQVHTVVERPYRVWLRSDLGSALGLHRYDLDASKGDLTVEARTDRELEVAFFVPGEESGVPRTLWNQSFAVAADELLTPRRFEAPGDRDRTLSMPFTNAFPKGGGWFRILELERGSVPGSIDRLALDFEHHVREDGTGVTLGQVRIDSEIPIDREWVAVALWLHRGPAPAGGAMPTRRLGSPGTTFAQREARPERLVFEIAELGTAPWLLSFASARGEPLELGRYLRAAPPGVQARDRPRLGVGLVDGECGSAEGWFEIRELVWGGDGALARFSATFDRRCDEPERAARGQINWDSAVRLADRFSFRAP